MDFEISKEQKAVLQSARRVLRKQVDPYVREQKFKRELVKKMGEQGFFGSAFPTQYGAAWLNDMDRPFTREVALAKLVAGEACVRAAGWAMEIHGGMGYTLELPVERYYRDSKVYQIGEGTANIMTLIIANDALGIKKANRPCIRSKIHIQDLN